MTSTRPRAGHDDELGQVAGIEVLPLAVLVLLVGTLLVANAWAVVDAKVATAAAAREAARSYVEADTARAADEAARRAAAEVVQGHGRDPARLRLERRGGAFRRCQRSTFEVSYPVPALVLPWIGGFGSGITVTSRHSEIVDPYRSGLAGRAGCG